MISMISVIDKMQKIIDFNISKFEFNDGRSCISTNVRFYYSEFLHINLMGGSCRINIFSYFVLFEMFEPGFKPGISNKYSKQ